MRKIDSKNQLWHREENGAIQIGFTKSFLDGLEQCWNILPAHNEQFKVKSPLLTIETNEQMYSLMSPVAGFFVACSTKAQNFPDKLTEEDVVIELALQQPPRVLNERDLLMQRIEAQQAVLRRQGELQRGAQLRAPVRADVRRVEIQENDRIFQQWAIPQPVPQVMVADDFDMDEE